MAVELLLAVSTIVVAAETSDKAQAAVVIENEHLVVEFLQSDAGPRLAASRIGQPVRRFTSRMSKRLHWRSSARRRFMIPRLRCVIGFRTRFGS